LEDDGRAARQESAGSPWWWRSFWSTASYTAGFPVPGGDTPHHNQTVTHPLQPGWKMLSHGRWLPSHTAHAIWQIRGQVGTEPGDGL